MPYRGHDEAASSLISYWCGDFVYHHHWSILFKKFKLKTFEILALCCNTCVRRISWKNILPIVLRSIILASRPPLRRCDGTSYFLQSTIWPTQPSAGNTFNYGHDVMTDTPTLAWHLQHNSSWAEVVIIIVDNWTLCWRQWRRIRARLW